MRTLIYKRTHSGDPDSETGEFGNRNCMGRVRSWRFDAVIGVGGTGREPQRERIARKLTWIGIGPHKTGNPQRPRITFDHFVYYGESGPLLEIIAPALAGRIYGRNVRVIIDSFSTEERLEAEQILDIARAAPPSPVRLRNARSNMRHKTCRLQNQPRSQ